MSEKKRSYFRIRRIAAAELVRLHAAGTLVHPDAVAWATSTLDAVDDVGGRVPVVERQKILDLLAKYPTTGLTITAIAGHFGEPERRVMAALYTMRKQGQVESVKHLGRAYYFPSKAAANAQRERFLRERQDHENKKAREYTAAHTAARQEKAAAAGKPVRKASVVPVKVQPAPPAPPAVAAIPAAAAKAPPRAMRAAPSIATQAKRPVEIITPAGAKITKHPTPLVLIDRFGAADPAQRLPGGFHEEWLALRAGGSNA
jgi:hypothetical protein